MSRLTRIFLGLLLIISMLMTAAWASFQKALVKPVINGQAVIIEIPKGTAFNEIVTLLLNQNAQIDPIWFKVIAYWYRLANKIQAGEYELKSGSTSLDVLQQFVDGRVKQYSITFPEGWRFNDMLQLLANSASLRHQLNCPDELNSHLKILQVDKTHPEGWFFPDTYSFTKNTSDVTLLRRAHQKMLDVLEAEWQAKQQDLPFENAYQALILASIIEKETALVSERADIAGVFIRRLQKGMPLQTDPTVIYGMGDSYQGDIRTKDLKAPTPYNTYVITGLPPTPIAMPGREAIHAALHPNSGDSLYFVAKGDGSHVFSSTLVQHNKAVKEFLHRQANHLQDAKSISVINND